VVIGGNGAVLIDKEATADHGFGIGGLVDNANL